jgi:hypothetical protein
LFEFKIKLDLFIKKSVIKTDNSEKINNISENVSNEHSNGTKSNTDSNINFKNSYNTNDEVTETVKKKDSLNLNLVKDQKENKFNKEKNNSNMTNNININTNINERKSDIEFKNQMPTLSKNNSLNNNLNVNLNVNVNFNCVNSNSNSNNIQNLNVEENTFNNNNQVKGNVTPNNLNIFNNSNLMKLINSNSNLGVKSPIVQSQQNLLNTQNNNSKKQLYNNTSFNKFSFPNNSFGNQFDLMNNISQISSLNSSLKDSKIQGYGNSFLTQSNNHFGLFSSSIFNSNLNLLNNRKQSMNSSKNNINMSNYSNNRILDNESYISANNTLISQNNTNLNYQVNSCNFNQLLTYIIPVIKFSDEMTLEDFFINTKMQSLAGVECLFRVPLEKSTTKPNSKNLENFEDLLSRDRYSYNSYNCNKSKIKHTYFPTLSALHIKKVMTMDDFEKEKLISNKSVKSGKSGTSNKRKESMFSEKSEIDIDKCISDDDEFDEIDYKFKPIKLKKGDNSFLFYEEEYFYNRPTLHQRIFQLFDENSELKSLKFKEISNDSWMSILWIPKATEYGANDVSFLVFYRFNLKSFSNILQSMEIIGVMANKIDDSNQMFWFSKFNFIYTVDPLAHNVYDHKVQEEFMRSKSNYLIVYEKAYSFITNNVEFIHKYHDFNTIKNRIL